MLYTGLLLEIARIAENQAKDVRQIAESIDFSPQNQRLCAYMYARFSWYHFALDNPDVTAEEIASAAADGFDVKGTV